MARREVTECDRCGALTGEGDQDRTTWGRCYAATLSGRDRVGTIETAADLCGGCLDDLVAFMDGKEKSDA